MANDLSNPTVPPENRFTFVGLGELLWDFLPQGPRLGGAPANFAYIAGLLGNRSVVASRLGRDDLAARALQQLRDSGLDTNFIQTDAAQPTGKVLVHIDDHGQPRYEICGPVAWDFLELSPEWRSLAALTSAVCYGSLAQRSETSRSTILQFLELVSPAAVRVFDVNLRQNFYSASVLLDSARHATIIKLNDEELPVITKLFDAPCTPASPGYPRCALEWMLDKTGANLVCMTRGAAGSVLATHHAFDQHNGVRIQIADAVGAGDAFTAALVHHYVRGASLPEMNEAANCMGAWVASCPGAMPKANPEVLDRVRRRGCSAAP